MHEKHKGHDAMHMEMVLILVFTLLIAQIALFEWKKRHYKSYAVRMTIGESLFFDFYLLFLLSDGYAAGAVVGSSDILFEESVVAFYYLLGNIFLYYWNCYEESLYETDLGNNTQV